MPKSYSQFRGMIAITRASLRSILRSPSTILFSVMFPLIFILVFGFLGGSGGVNLKIAIDPMSDTANQVYSALVKMDGISRVQKPSREVNEELEKGRLTAIVTIRKRVTGPGEYEVALTSSAAVLPQNIRVLRSLLEGIIKGINEKTYPQQQVYAKVMPEMTLLPGRQYRTIDFILPGQLGFSLLSAGVFGVAFIFFNLRQTLVLKRFFATPVSRSHILYGEAVSRIVFQMITAIVILSIGHFAFQFTLVHGWVTFLELMLLSLFGLVVFMGFGFVVSGLAKSESSIPPLANVITLPQFLLTGTFFSIDNFPAWLQPFCRILPLTHLNDAMRNVAFEGNHIYDCGKQLGILGIWAVIVYAAAIKVFRWE